MAGIANLFTREFYELSKRRLAPDGIMVQWIQLYRMFPSDVKLLLKTFQEVFPYTTIWTTVPGDLAVVGSVTPHQLDYERLKQQLARPEIRQDLLRVAMADPRVFVEFFWLGPEQVRQLTADVGWLHTDDRPWVEFNAPKALYLGPALDLNYQGLERFKAPASAIAPATGDRTQDAAFYVELGKTHRFRQVPEKAIEAFERAVALDANLASAWAQLGELYSQRGEILKAQEALTEAARVDPNPVEAHEALGRILWRQGKREEAIASYERAADLKVPDSARAEELGDAYRQTKRYREAAECFRSALAQDGPHQPSLFLSLALVLKELERFDEAERVLDVAINRDPGEATLALLLAQVHLAQGHWEEAKMEFERVLKKAPATPSAHFGLGEIAFKQGHLKSARESFMAGLRFDAYHVKALETLQAIGVAQKQQPQ
jgi:tetratricopeptide (TPR) repeat protein